MDEHPEIKQEILDISDGLGDEYDIEYDVPEYINIKTQIPIGATLIVASENKNTTSKVNKPTQKNATVKIKKELNDEHELKPKRQRYTPKPKTCDICGQQLTCTKSLTIHMRIHNDEKPYKCEICGKLFRQQSGVTSHMVTHSKEKPFPCLVNITVIFCKMKSKFLVLFPKIFLIIFFVYCSFFYFYSCGHFIL